MAETFLNEYPELKQFVLSDVPPPRTRIGGGAYGVVDEVDVPVRAAAKSIHAILQERDYSIPADQLPKAAREFVDECQLMSKLRHPNIVQFLGVTFFPDSDLPALVMERLLTSLHDLLDPETPRPPGVNTPISFSLVLRIIVLQNVASGLAYLHGRTPKVIHRDLSARNILLDSEMVAKIADLGMARIMRERAAATMTKGPGASVYMPPEASAPAQSNKEKSKYDASIDVFSLGVVTIFTIGGVFPCVPLPATYHNDETGVVVARTELQRRSEYMRYVNEHLRRDHPLIELIQQSLHNKPQERPGIQDVLRLLEEARASIIIRDGEIERKKRELVRSLQTQPMKQNLEHILRDLVTENANKEKVIKDKEEECMETIKECTKLRKELTEKGTILLEKEQKLEIVNQTLREMEMKEQILHQQLKQKDKPVSSVLQIVVPLLAAMFVLHIIGEFGINYPSMNVLFEFTDSSGRPLPLQSNVTAHLELVFKATPTNQSIVIHLDQNETRKLVNACTIELHSEIEIKNKELDETRQTLKQKESMVETKDEELNETQHKLKQKEDQLESCEREKNQAQIEFNEIINKQSNCYRSHVSGPGLTSAIFRHPTHVLVELTNFNGIHFSMQQRVTAQLISKEVPQTTILTVTVGNTTGWNVNYDYSKYNVWYTAVNRGQHKLHVQVNDREINGSPFRVTVYPDPRQLHHPERNVTDLNAPYGIAFNNHEQMIVSEYGGHRMSIFDIRGKKNRTFGSYGDRSDQMKYPRGIATDDTDNIYVSSSHKVQKFTSSGDLIKCIGRQGSKKEEFNNPRGITVYNNQVYVCDKDNHRIQVFDLDLNFVQPIGSHGKGRGEFDKPYNVKFDTAGNMYVAELGNSRVQVLDSRGRFIQFLGQKGERGMGKLSQPSDLHIADKYVYVSDCDSHCVVVYETSGQFVTSFGRYGENDGEFRGPFCITSCVDGFIYVCDYNNNRVQIF